MKEITTKELRKRIDQGENLHIIDVREPSEYEVYNIGATLIPLGRFRNDDIDELQGLEEEEIILHCRSGKRSGQAALILEDKGFKNVKNLVGGILQWQEDTKE